MEEGYTVKARIIKETEKAFLLWHDRQEFWVPKSQVVQITKNIFAPNIFAIPEWLVYHRRVEEDIYISSFDGEVEVGNLSTTNEVSNFAAIAFVATVFTLTVGLLVLL
jgi:hypothetical protein